jgi:hypothetical protein
MNSSQALMATLSSIEKHLASFQEDQDQQDTQEKTAKLQSLVSSLSEETQVEKTAGCLGSLISVEKVLSTISKKGSATKEDCAALSLAVSKLASLGKAAAVDDTVKEELDLYIENDGRMYKSKLRTLGSLVRKKKEGKYNSSLAVKLWLLWVTEGTKMYFREFPETPKDTFSKELCLSLAKEIEQREEKRIDLGEYEGMKFASQEQQEDSQEEQEGQDKKASEEEQEDTQEQQEKEASISITASDISEALAHSVMAKVEAALKVVESSDKANTLVAKKDLGRITSDLTKLIEASDLNDESIQNPLKRLAGMADQVHSYFA